MATGDWSSNVAEIGIGASLIFFTGTGYFEYSPQTYQQHYLSQTGCELFIDDSDAVNEGNTRVGAVNCAHFCLDNIKKIINPTISELAKCLNVSRQAVYKWMNGEQPAVERMELLADISNAADMFAQSGIPVTGYNLNRKFIQGKNFFEAVHDGISACEYAQVMIRVLKEEMEQRARLPERLSRRPVHTINSDIDIMLSNG